MQLNIEIVTPEKVILNEKADYVTLPSKNGEIEILFSHSPLIVSLSNGIMKVKNESGSKSIGLSSGGSAQIQSDKIVVVAESAVEI